MCFYTKAIQQESHIHIFEIIDKLNYYILTLNIYKMIRFITICNKGNLTTLFQISGDCLCYFLCIIEFFLHIHGHISMIDAN